MEYYRNYKILENSEQAMAINIILKFIYSLPGFGRLFNKKYRFYGLKKFLYSIRPIVRLLLSFGLSLMSLFIVLLSTGSIIKVLDKLMGGGYFNVATSGTYSFLAFYLTQAILANKIVNARPYIKMVYYQWRMSPKEIALALSFFTLLKEAIGRALAFSIYFTLWQYPAAIAHGIIFSFLIMFIAMIASACHLYIFEKKGRAISNKVWYYILLFIITFSLFFKIKTINSLVLGVIFFLSLGLFIKAVSYIFNYENYKALLEGTKTLGDMNASYQEAYEESIALEDKNSIEKTSAKGTGFEYLNNIFFERYRDKVKKPFIKRDFIIFALMLAAIFYAHKFNLSPAVVEKYFPLLILILSFINFNSEGLIRLIFISCDRMLMPYSFYKDPVNISELYEHRLISFIGLNILGIALLLVGRAAFAYVYKLSSVILYATYIIIAGIFFAAYYLTLYYIAQPYSYDGRVVGSVYKTVNYLIGSLYFFIFPILVRETGIDGKILLALLIGLMVIFISLAPLMVKNLAPKNFRIKK